jgi:serine protease Do
MTLLGGAPDPTAAARRVCLVACVLLLPMLAGTSACARMAGDSFAPLVKKVQPAVVNIAVTEEINNGDALAELPPELKNTPFGKQFLQRLRKHHEEAMGAGSGFVIDPSGIIVTNVHVVGGASRIVVSLSDGTELPARVVGIDELTDIAVIKVTTTHPLVAVPWGDSRLMEVGDWILAAGNPFGLGGSVTAGIISARGRDIGAGPFDNFLQLDAPINPGNSGGPTFNMQGQVVGVNTAIVSPSGGSVGIGFAIPSEVAAPIVAELRAKGHIDRGWLGVSVADPGAAEGEPGADAPLAGVHPAGVTISAVARNSPAARAGLVPGDLIEAVNGEHIETALGLIRAIAATQPGEVAHLLLRRHGRRLDVPVTVGRRPDNMAG